ncbi:MULTISPECIES: TIGR03986 family CRISPR-associated RAMP protein [Spirulina sp. CCY15215]|uniref:TIGR03986 family type III CRISPR-associated RAMP protein n=1 Tax=Spirulina sp. CCY15215 TaxID=2767591 RepID=UPI0019529943|nr:TIGR03986 family CRISPR-associated RAMP protein [Spirulina major]
MSFPKHLKHVPEDRKAVAPYNFVELPETVVKAEELPTGDRYYPSKGEDVTVPRYTGKFQCTLTTQSVVYTRCGWSPDDFKQYAELKFNELPDEIKKKRANFFTYPDSEKPVIPGSSLRGMLRTLVEIVSFSKITQVTNYKLFYRSLGDPALKTVYMENFVEKIGKVQHSPHPLAPCYRSKVRAGFLKKKGSFYVIEECGFGRIDRKKSNRIIPQNNDIYRGHSPNKTPNWNYQNQTIYVDIDSTERDYFFPKQTTNRNNRNKLRHPDIYLRYRKVHKASFTPSPDLIKATLVLTGDMKYKHLEFVFLDQQINEYIVPESMINRFHDEDQITKWQGEAFPKDSPSPNCRQKKGHLRDSEPVFFLLDDQEKIHFFGRAQMFRLPYSLSPLDFVPEYLRKNTETDIVEAIFGYVEGEKRANARAGRIFITDGLLKQNQQEKIKNSLERTPQEILLSSPKPTTFQHYLVQENHESKNLKHYLSQPSTKNDRGQTVIRGHKLYWHKPVNFNTQNSTSDTQTSLIKPIGSSDSSDSSIQFSFDIHFENLTKIELGAILWILSLSNKKSKQFDVGKPDEQYCLSFGMGKPLGMGAVSIDYELFLSDRTKRYSQLFGNSQWKAGEEKSTDVQQIESIRSFEKFVLDTISPSCDRLRQEPRIQSLLAMLRCDKIPSQNEIKYMELKCFKNRPVLPTPLQVIGWEDDQNDDNNPNSGGSGGTPKPKPKPRDPTGSTRPKKKSDKQKSFDWGGMADTTGGINKALQRSKRPKPR